MYGRNLTDEQWEAVAILQLPPEDTLFMSDETWNLLLVRRLPPGLVGLFMARIERIVPMRYQRRWARRLRQNFGFGREDAYQLALATFGSVQQGTLVGIDVFVTFDQRLIDGFYRHLSQIEIKLRRMTAQLRHPYSQAILPMLATPHVVLSIQA